MLLPVDNGRILDTRISNTMQAVLEELGEQTVPNTVEINEEVKSLELSLWILRKKFNFSSAVPLKPICLTQVNKSKEVLSKFKFLLLISASAINAVYNHVVVVQILGTPPWACQIRAAQHC
jgi:hypothetical protein